MTFSKPKLFQFDIILLFFSEISAFTVAELRARKYCYFLLFFKGKKNQLISITNHLIASC